MESSSKSLSSPPFSSPDFEAKYWTQELRNWLGLDVEIWDAIEKNPIDGEGHLATSFCRYTGILSEIDATGQPGFVTEKSPLIIAATPLSFLTDRHWIAVSPLLCRPLQQTDDIASMANLMNRRLSDFRSWCQNQLTGSPEWYAKLGAAFVIQQIQRQQIETLDQQISLYAEAHHSAANRATVS
jgi:hypothetical protein